MEFMEHLGRLLGGTVGEAELRRIAMAAVSRSVRETKLAIAEAAWQARSFAAEGRQAEGARRMCDVRRLRDQYRASIEEYARLASSDSSAEAGTEPVAGEQHPDVIAGGQREAEEEAA